MNDERKRGQAAVQRSFEPATPAERAAADDLSRESQQDERRERYAAAISSTYEYAEDFNAAEGADAAMAVADEELDKLYAYEQAGSNALLEELETARGDNAQLYRAGEACREENARLRAENRQVQETLAALIRHKAGHRSAEEYEEMNDFLREELMEARNAISRQAATIRRVEALERHGPTLTWDEIRAALEGES